MPATIELDSLDVSIKATPLTNKAFAPFGHVIQNPRPNLHPAEHYASSSSNNDSWNPNTASPLPCNGQSANQGSAIKYQDISPMVNNYPSAPSRSPGRPVMSMFVCAARKLVPPVSSSTTTSSVSCGTQESSDDIQGVFPVRILERHPYTTQTFIPLSKSNKERYLVIVAPSMRGTTITSTAPSAPSAVGRQQDGGGEERGERQVQDPPDLNGIKAFVADGRQAVTYGAGTWHAPMVALGKEGTAVDFVVVQFVSGVGEEDCEEVVFGVGGGEGKGREGKGKGIMVEVPVAGVDAKL